MYYSPASRWKVAANLSPYIKYGLAAAPSGAWPYPDPPAHPPLEPHFTIPLSHLHDPLYQGMPDPPLWWSPSGNGGGGGGAPGAPVNSVQFNNSGVFGGDAGLTWTSANGLQVGGMLQGVSGTSTNYSINPYSGTAWFNNDITTNGNVDAGSGNGTFNYLNINVDGQFGGIIVIGRDPVNPLEVATKQYVDARGKTAALNLGVVTNSTPQDGDLWYDGTHLNFHHGGTTTALV